MNATASKTTALLAVALTVAIGATAMVAGMDFGRNAETEQQIVKLERVVIVGKRAEVAQLPRIVVEGRRADAPVLVASAR